MKNSYTGVQCYTAAFRAEERVVMKDGFIKVAAVTPKIKVADPAYNAEVICERLDEAWKAGARIIVFPEMCLTGYTCGDLFLQRVLLEEACQVFDNVKLANELDVIDV